MVLFGFRHSVREKHRKKMGREQEARSLLSAAKFPKLPLRVRMERRSGAHFISIGMRMLISFEGLDASGKSTQIKLLRDGLEQRGRTVLVLREPGGTSIGETIRHVLLDKKNLAMSAAAELFLFSASRSQLVDEVIQPALGRGAVVILDRYYDSTTAYQGYGRGIDLNTINRINRLATGGLAPQLTFFVDIPIDEVEQRLRRANVGRDRMESSGTDFYTRVRNGYRVLAQTESRFRLMDGTQSVETIQLNIWREVEQALAAQSKGAV